jgi:hypothetical protein
VCLVGMKSDLEAKRSVPLKDVDTLAAAKHIYTIETRYSEFSLKFLIAKRENQ